MTPEEFRHWGHQVVDWIARYLSEVERYPVQSQVEPGAVRARLPAGPPTQGEPFDRLLRDVEEILIPGLTHWQSPNFFAYFPCNNSGPSILGELLSAGLGVQGMLWATSPACTELETHVLDWMADLLDLPTRFRSSGPGGGVIQDTASSAALCALLAAREQAGGGAASQDGVAPNLTAYASTQAHSSIEKAVMIAGLGARNLRRIEVDVAHAMRPEKLAEAIAADRAQGKVPCWVCATVGTTSSLAIDPLRAIGEICRRERVWLHVDAAMSGIAAVCPEYRWIHDGLELADSYCTNAHKWMFVNFDCDCFFVADRGALIRPLQVVPEYLKNQATDSRQVIDYRDWQVPLGRRFRALKLWFVIRSFGVEGLRQRIRQHLELARQLAGWVGAHPRFELAAPATLNLVCFRHRGGEAITQQVLDRANRSGEMALSHTRLDGKLTLRLCVGQTGTEERHVRHAWDLLCQIAEEVERAGV
jgi:aromatic-L-amino-acid decarboxylase